MTANAVNEVRTLEIVETNYAANRTGTGMVLVLGAQFIDSVFNPHAKPLEIVIPLEDDNEEVQNRGQRDFAGLRLATGVLNPTDSDELLFKPFRAIVTRPEERFAILRYLWGDEAEAA